MHNFPLLSVLLDAPSSLHHDYIMEWKHFPRYWPFVRGIHRSPVNSPHKCQWREASMYSLVRAWAGGWVHTRVASDFRRHLVHYDVTVVMMRLSRALVLCAVTLLQRSHRGAPWLAHKGEVWGVFCEILGWTHFSILPLCCVQYHVIPNRNIIESV